FAQRDRARTGDELPCGAAGRHEDPQWEPCEVITWQEPFRGKVAVRVELGQLGCWANVVPEQIELPVGLILLSLVFLVFIAAYAKAPAFNRLGCPGQKRPGGAVESAPS